MFMDFNAVIGFIAHAIIKHARRAAYFSLVLLLPAGLATAEPYLAVKTNNKCMACHVNPIGGGARNDFGAYYGAQLLPETVGEVANSDPGRVTDTVRLGADLRLNYDQSDSDADESKSFNTQNGQVYLAVQPKGSRVLFYLDQQIAPGSSFSREAFVLAKLKNNHYLKAGKIMLPFGLRLEDDSAFIRSATGINFDNSDNGVELGLEFAKATINFALSNGSTGASNDDDQFQYALRGVYLGNYWRVGGSALLNDNELGERSMFNVFGAFNWNRFAVLAEIDWIEDESVTNVFGEPPIQVVTFFEINTELAKGYNLKLTTEYFDPDDDVAENARTRHSVLLEYTPFAYLQVRGGVRVGEDIPQREVGNFTDVFLQAHVYF